MHIIIDGYNLIRQSDSLRRFEQFSLEAGRRELIRRVSRYKKIKGHKITIVFDGWLEGSPEESRVREEGVHVVYSRKGEKADEAICRMAARGGEEIVVVSSDHAIARRAVKSGSTALSSPDFEALMKREEEKAPLYGEGMDGADIRDDDEEGSTVTKKRGPSRRPSKKERLAEKRLKKL